jgi:hypothetical protein
LDHHPPHSCRIQTDLSKGSIAAQQEQVSLHNPQQHSPLVLLKPQHHTGRYTPTPTPHPHPHPHPHRRRATSTQGKRRACEATTGSSTSLPTTWGRRACEANSGPATRLQKTKTRHHPSQRRRRRPPSQRRWRRVHLLLRLVVDSTFLLLLSFDPFYVPCLV